MKSGRLGRPLLGLFLFIGAGPSSAPARTGARPARKDTAGLLLGKVWATVRLHYPDAVLLSISGRTEADGSVRCAPDSAMLDGWRYHFYSPRKDAYLLMGRCDRSITGPAKEIRSLQANPARGGVEGRFIDADKVIEVLKENKISLEPMDHQAYGKRPFTLELYRTMDPRYKEHPVLWQVGIGKSAYLVNAETKKILEDAPDESLGAPGLQERPASSPSGPLVSVAAPSSGVAKRPSASSGRPKRGKAYTAKTDLEAVAAYVRKHLPGAVLMAVEGITDAWGGLTCMGSGDGWVYYYYWPRKRTTEAVCACRGAVSQALPTYVPVDMGLHQPISGDFIDTNAVLDSLLREEGSSLNEGLGRYYTRRPVLRLRHYRTAPFYRHNLMHLNLIWEVEAGSSIYYIDARKGVFIGKRE